MLLLGEIVIEPILIILTGRFTLLGLNRRYSVLFELTKTTYMISSMRIHL